MLRRSEEGSVGREGSWLRRGAVLAGSGLLLAALASGCGDDGDPNPGASDRDTTSSTTTTTQAAVDALTCDRVEGEEWIAIPSNIDTERIAATLGVTPESVADGSMGPVTCEPAIPASDVDRGRRATVEGFIAECLPVFIQSGEPPAEGVLYDSFVVVCPAVDATVS